MAKSRKSPKWLRQGIIYQLFLRSFTPEGTISAASEKLPWLKELGINIIYLSPICIQDNDMREEFWSERQIKSGENNPCNPYRVTDYYRIDKEYGTDYDLQMFVNKCHELGLRIFLDLVYFHCGPTAVFLAEYPNYAKHNPDGTVFTGEWNFPVLNFDNEELREYLYDNMLYWVEKFGVDGYRCDAAGYVPLDFWEEAHRRLDSTGKEIVLFAECCLPEGQLQAFDLEYNYMGSNIFKSCLQEETTTSIYDHIQYLSETFPEGALFSLFLDNHDIANDSERNRREAIMGFEAANAALVAIFTMKGVPFIYNGQEIADKAQHSIFAKYCIDWANTETEEGKKRFELIKQLSSLRLNNRELTHGKFVRLENSLSDYVLSYLRKLESNTLLIIINLNSTAENVCIDKVNFENHDVHDLMSLGAKLEISEDGLKADVAPYGFIISRI